MGVGPGFRRGQVDHLTATLGTTILIDVRATDRSAVTELKPRTREDSCKFKCL